MKKLQLIWVPYKCVRVNIPHYDLCTKEKNPSNIGCLATDKNGAKLIRQWINWHNKKQDN